MLPFFHTNTPAGITATNDNQAFISVSVQDLTTLLPTLIAQQINFQVHYPQERNTDLNNKITTHPLPHKPYPQQQAFEHIYDKYICSNNYTLMPTQEDVAMEVGMSGVGFKNTFKRLYGRSFFQLQMQQRMEYAAELLTKGYKANEVAQMIGYGEKSAIKFNKMFQKHFGITPKKYQMTNLVTIRRRGRVKKES